ncbi:DUF1707 SHOCT-like domain-containing protein [Propionibacteriaceae bacterium Y1923]
MSDDLRIPVQRGAMRASDADRRLVEEVLNTAFVDGRLTKDELDERLEQVGRSKTFDDLAPITADLLPGAPVAQYATPVAHPGGPLVESSTQSHEVDSISAVLGEHKRVSTWRMAPSTEVSAVLGEVVLDLNQAVLESPNPRLKVDLLLAEVNIFVPAGVSVVNQISPILAETNIKGLADENPQVTLTLTGTTVLGEVNVLGPHDNSSRSRKRRKGK